MMNSRISGRKLLFVLVTLAAAIALQGGAAAFAQSTPIGVVLCDRPYFAGRCQAFTSDTPDLNATVLGDGATSSIRVATGWAVSVWANSYYSFAFGGRCQTFTSDVPSLLGSYIGNNDISSLRLNVDCDGNPIGVFPGGGQVGRPTPPSAPPPPPTPPGTPSNFQISSVASGSITLNWIPQGGVVSIYSPFTCACFNDVPNLSSYTFGNLTYGGWYCFIAYAYNAGGYSGWTSWACSIAR